MISKIQRSFNLSIHGLRGLAALMVFLFHIYDMSRLQGLVAEDMPFALKVAIVSMSSGVDLFFMISGYLITSSLFRHANVRIFLIDRVIRIYPVFLFLHVILFVLSPLIGYKWLAGIHFVPWLLHFFSNLFLLPGTFDLPLLQLNAWSLSYEFAFYLLSAAVYALFKRHKNVMAWALLLAIAPAFIYFHPRAAFFVIGVAVFLLEKNHVKIAIKQQTLGLICVPPFMVILGMAYAMNELQFAWAALPFGFFIFLDVVRNKKAFAMLLHSKAMQFLGTISYSFYLWHPVVTYPLKLIMSKILVGRLDMDPVIAIVIFGFVSFVLVIPVSYVSYLLLEKKTGRWLRAKAGDGQRIEIASSKI